MPQNRPAGADSTDRRNYRPRNDLRLAVFTIVYNPLINSYSSCMR